MSETIKAVVRQAQVAHRAATARLSRERLTRRALKLPVPVGAGVRRGASRAPSARRKGSAQVV